MTIVLALLGCFVAVVSTAILRSFRRGRYAHYGIVVVQPLRLLWLAVVIAAPATWIIYGGWRDNMRGIVVIGSLALFFAFFLVFCAVRHMIRVLAEVFS